MIKKSFKCCGILKHDMIGGALNVDTTDLHSTLKRILNEKKTIVNYVDEDFELGICDDFDSEKCIADPLDVDEVEIVVEDIMEEEMEIDSNLPCTSAQVRHVRAPLRTIRSLGNYSDLREDVVIPQDVQREFAILTPNKRSE